MPWESGRPTLDRRRPAIVPPIGLSPAKPGDRASRARAGPYDLNAMEETQATAATIADEILSAPVDGIGLQARTLGGEIGGGTHLLVFLRHFG